MPFSYYHSSLKPLFSCALISLVISIGLFLSTLSNSLASNVVDRADLNAIFIKHRITGTFVLFSPAQDQLTVINPVRAAERYIPASTFKIINSLIALQTAVVGSENEIIPFGGNPQPFKSWEKDMSMTDAIRISNVPIYQEIARRVGIRRYIEWLRRLDYGNQQVGRDVETFWLRGPLKISAIEQVRFLGKLAQKKLPVKEAVQSTVMKLVKLRNRRVKSLYGKTGWTNTPEPDIGWFVGWIAEGNKIHTFALNMDIRARQDAKFRKSITIEFLKELGIF